MAYVKKDMLCAKVYHNLRSNYLIYYFHSWYRKGATPFWLCTQAMHATSNSHKAFLVRWFATAIDDVHYLTVEAETYQELVGNMATIMYAEATENRLPCICEVNPYRGANKIYTSERFTPPKFLDPTKIDPSIKAGYKDNPLSFLMADSTAVR
jgi:hypothetical protein